MTTDSTKFLGFEKSQLPLASLILAVAAILITLQLEMWIDSRAYTAEVKAHTAETKARTAATIARAAEIRAENEARANAIRADMMNDLRADFNALTVEMAEMNARLNALEREQALLTDRVDALAPE